MKEIDSCPWCKETKPVFSVYLEGHRDNPYVVVKLYCPDCNTARHYFPTEEEISKYGFNKYGDNKRLVGGIFDKLADMWNWK